MAEANEPDDVKEACSRVLTAVQQLRRDWEFVANAARAYENMLTRTLDGSERHMSDARASWLTKRHVFDGKLAHLVRFNEEVVNPASDELADAFERAYPRGRQ